MHSKQSHGHDNPVKQIQCHNHKQVHAFNTKSWTRQIRLNNYSVTNGYVHSLQKHGHDKSGQTNTVSQTDSIQKAWTRQITTMSQSQADTCNQYKIMDTTNPVKQIQYYKRIHAFNSAAWTP